VDEVARPDECADERLAGDLLGLSIVAVAEGVPACAREERVDAVLRIADAVFRGGAAAKGRRESQ
jgi:hypothetical protein